MTSQADCTILYMVGVWTITLFHRTETMKLPSLQTDKLRENNPVLNAILCKTANMSDEEIRSLLNKRIVSKDITLKYIAKALNVNMHKTETKPLNIVIE